MVVTDERALFDISNAPGAAALERATTLWTSYLALRGAEFIGISEVHGKVSILFKVHNETLHMSVDYFRSPAWAREILANKIRGAEQRYQEALETAPASCPETAV